MCKEHCGGADPAYDCRKKSTAARKDVHEAAGSTTVSDHGKKRSTDNRECSSDVGKGRRGRSAASLTEPERQAGTQALPVDTNTRVEDNVGARLLMSEAPETTSAGTVGYKDRQPIPKRGRGRPRTITDMKAYKAMKQREHRERKRNG